MSENQNPYTKTTDAGISTSAVTTAVVATEQTTASTSYTDLSTAGPAVTVNIGPSGAALVIVGAHINNPGGFPSYMSFAVSGATTAAPATANAFVESGVALAGGSRVTHVTGLTPGSNTFTAKYVVDSNTGHFQNRRITVIPL